MNLTAYQNIDTTSRGKETLLVNILYIKNTDKARLFFSCMQISSPHNLNLRSDSKETRFLSNVF